MGFLTPPRRFAAELIDQSNTPSGDLVNNLHDLVRLNHQFGGVRVVLRQLQRLIATTHPRHPISVLDLGTGAADIPRAIVCWARQQHLPLRITALDINPVMLEVARKECVEFPQINLEQQDLLALPYEVNSFDYVISSQVLHHFSETEAIRILQQSNRIARCGYVMADLRRGLINYGAVWAATRVFSKSYMIRQDGPASILNAFTPWELRALAHRAGLSNYRVARQRHFRMVLTGLK